MTTPAKTWLILLGIGLFGSSIAAHGANYPPPPRFYNGPVDTAGQRPDPSKSNPGAAGPNSPTSPVPAPATGPGSPISPLPTNPGNGAANSGGIDPFLDSSAWEFWWEFNKEPFLELRRHLGEPPALTGIDGYYLGRGARRYVSGAENRIDREVVRTKVIPALLETLAASDSNDLTTGCLVALAKAANSEDDSVRGSVEEVLRRHLAEKNQEVAETAAAALGILGLESSVILLGELAADRPLGRQAVRRSRVPIRTRTFAAYALGLVGHRTPNEDVRRYVVHQLSQVLESYDNATRDLPTACILSIGRVPLAWAVGDEAPEGRRPVVASCRETQVRALLKVFEDPKADHFVRGHTASSLGTLLSQEIDETHAELIDDVASKLAATLRSAARTPPEVRQSCAIALGLLGDADGEELDAEIRKTLRKAAVDDRDRIVRRFALIALGRVGARPGRGADPKAVAEIRELLLHQLSRGSTAMRDWSALALGILERYRFANGAIPDSSVADALRIGLGEARSSSAVGAYAVANGILGDVESASALRAVLLSKGEDRVRGLAAVALGLVEAEQDRELLRRQALEAVRRPDFLREVAIGLGLLGDREASTLLVQAFGTTKSLSSRAAIARALGRIGDADSIDPLISLLRSDEETGIARALAAVALGSIADQDVLPWNTILSVDTNYTVIPPTLYDAQGFGILNIL